jgi:hypothetical protein
MIGVTFPPDTASATSGPVVAELVTGRALAVPAVSGCVHVAVVLRTAV